MPKEEWGTKRLCPHCATRFYDLRNDPVTCPACGSQYSIETLVEGRGKALVSEKTAAVAEEEDDLVDDDDLTDDSGELDDDLLDEDDDDGDVSLDDIADVAESDED